jgi:hypothetical protein
MKTTPRILGWSLNEGLLVRYQMELAQILLGLERPRERMKNGACEQRIDSHRQSTTQSTTLHVVRQWR